MLKTNLMFLVIAGMALILSKGLPRHRAGRIMISRHVLSFANISFKTSIVCVSFLFLMMLLVFQSQLWQHLSFNRLTPLLAAVLTGTLVIYPKNIHLGLEGIAKSGFFPLNSFYFEFINRRRVRDIQIKKLKERYLLIVSYRSLGGHRDKNFQVRLPKRDYPVLEDWKNRIKGEG